jgi:hypothetical protein
MPGEHVAALHTALKSFEGQISAFDDTELDLALNHLRQVVGSIELVQQKKPLLYRLFGVARHAGLGAHMLAW